MTSCHERSLAKFRVGRQGAILSDLKTKARKTPKYRNVSFLPISSHYAQLPGGRGNALAGSTLTTEIKFLQSLFV